MTRTALALCISLSAPGIAFAVSKSSCPPDDTPAAQCFNIRGRLSYWNGAPSARIWPIGTKRILGVHNDDLPSDLATRMPTFESELWGEMTVCPITKARPGEMQMVCIASWHDLAAKERGR